MSKAKRHSPPTDVRMGWVDTDVKRDAAELAKGDAVKHLRAYENAWYAVMPFLGGHLWEIQENGSGHSYLPSVVEALAKNVDPVWFQVGVRAHTVAIRDGKAQCLIQNVAQSKLLIDGNKPQVRPRGRMQPVVRKGKGIFAFGASVFGTGFLFLLASGIGYVALERIVPEARTLDIDNLPYRQWSKVSTTADGLYVEALKFQNNQWTTAMKPKIRTSLADVPADGAVSRPMPSSVPAQPAAPAGAPPFQAPSKPVPPLSVLPGVQAMPQPPRPTGPLPTTAPVTVPPGFPATSVQAPGVSSTVPAANVSPTHGPGVPPAPMVGPPPVRAVGPGVTGAPPQVSPLGTPAPSAPLPGSVALPPVVPPVPVSQAVSVPGPSQPVRPAGAPVPPPPVAPPAVPAPAVQAQSRPVIPPASVQPTPPAPPAPQPGARLPVPPAAVSPPVPAALPAVQQPHG